MHKDTIKEVLEYRNLKDRVDKIFGPEVTISWIIDELERKLSEPGNANLLNAKILTYEDAKMWEEYKKLGTPEEIQKKLNNL